MTALTMPPNAGQRVIVRINWGPLALRRAVLEPGRTLRVGRAEAADFAVPRDEQMSDLHFEVSWTGEQCLLRDLKSGTGTLLRGERVEEGAVTHGSWVRAGGTDFSVYFEGATPPRAPPETLEMSAPKVKALEGLRAQEQPLFAALDAARDDRILELLRESVEEYRSLYEGPEGDAMAEVAPYLVSLPKDSRLLEALVREGWGQSWGIYLTCGLPFLELRRHLRKFLMVEMEGEEGRMYFRYYDPRVLQAFLPTCAPEQKADFFGEIGCYLMESKEEGALVRFVRLENL